MRQSLFMTQEMVVRNITASIAIGSTIVILLLRAGM